MSLGRAGAALAEAIPSTQPTTQPATQSTTTQPTAPDFSADVTGDWWGARRKLAQAGVTIGATFVAEGFDNLQGGVSTAHADGSTTFDLNGTFDMEKLARIDGGEFYVDLEDHAFHNPSTALVGDLQVFDKTNSSPFLQIFELWYQQKLFNDTLRLKIGKVDANTEFSVIDNALPFLSSSSQVSPTVFMMPTTPDPMPSINAFFTPTSWYFASVGAYYANRSDRFGDLIDDPARIQPAEFGTFIIGETGFQWHISDCPGNVKVGAWGDTGTFQKFDGTYQQGTDGMYAIFDQVLYRPKGPGDTTGGIQRVFLEYGLTQPDINPIDEHIGGGFTTDAGDPDDTLGLGAQYAHITREAGLPHTHELSIEGFDRFQIAPFEVLQPDIQYIIHPGGKYADAVVLTLRWELNF